MSDSRHDSLARAGNNTRILFVDDEATLTRMAANLLTILGHEVDTFTDSREAVEAFRNHSDAYHLVITDLSMPGLKGTELAEQIRAVRGKVPIILCTGYGELIDSRELLSRGIVDVVMAKPVSMAELKNAIHEALSQSGAD